MALKPPVEVPQGAIRLNTDSQKLEFFAQEQWWQMATEESSPIAGRGIILGSGANPRDEIQYFSLVTMGDAADFGNLNSGRSSTTSVSNSIRGYCCGGYYAPGEQNEIQEIIIATQGNAIDFGDLTHTMARGNRGEVSSSTRGIVFGRQGYYDVIQYITLGQKGNAVDFGNLTYSQENAGGCGSPTRGIVWGGEKQPSPHYINNIEYITIATTGNAVDFGDDLSPSGSGYLGSNSQSSPIRAFFTTGYQPSPGTSTKMIRSFNIASGGTAIDWGDASTVISGLSGLSNAHGGLG